MRIEIYITRFPCIFLILFLSLLLIGCRPKGILSSRQMREVLVDLHKTDGMLQVGKWGQADTETKDLFYAQVLEKHGTTQAEFDSSLVWYTAHPQFFNKIYPKVLKELEKQEEAFKEQYAEELAGIREPAPVASTNNKEFTPSDLDSVLWVTQHGYCHSWKRWHKPFSMLNDER